ncbi:MAG: aminoacyl-tRNA hydrolase [Chlamydiota bacterium]
MDSERQKVLITGLGNPGTNYERTRHNLGRTVLFSFAGKHALAFRKARELKGEIATGNWQDGKVFLLFPTTYMNLSGQAVRKTMRFYKITIDAVLILSDDIALPFGTLRFRTKGSAGGHNGLKSIEECIGTNQYQRLKLGIGEPSADSLEDYVLKPFTKEEQEKIPEIAARGIKFIEEWLVREIKEHA